MSLKRLLSEIEGGWVKAKNEKFTGHPIATLLRKDLILAIKSKLDLQSNYLIKASAGAGNWADVPWLSILNPAITESTQSGVYPVYLFCSDGSGVYLSLGFGTTDLKKQHGAAQARFKAKELRSNIRNSDLRLNRWDEKIDLRSTTSLGRSYEWASAGAKFYPLENMPDDSVLISDLTELLEIYADVHTGIQTPNREAIKQAHPLSKPFLLLAGISGTGKTRFIREQAKFTGSIEDTYCLTSVRPDWHEPSDILGYVSRLSGNTEYIVTDVLKFIVKAWIALEQAGIIFQGKEVTGEQIQQQQVKPFWLCLDEMNLAPIEQYFADYLSVLETREWEWQGENFTYKCDALLKSTVFETVSQDKLKQELGLDEHEELWQHFIANGIAIPFNLIVAGTVNMDETTHGFSRKVIDRALTFDFGEFFPNDFDAFFEPNSTPKALSYPVLTDGRDKAELSGTFDKDGALSLSFLKQINIILEHTPFKLAYRALNELLLAVITQSPQSEIELQSVLDDFLMCKVLPRIEGDIDKLTKGDSNQTILEQLSALLTSELSTIWDTNTRHDLFLKSLDDDPIIKIECRSKMKLEWMNAQLKHGFTSFWP
ncbi:DUF3578 domain-containing protein [Parashewanella spongiae]|uniref:DUF3578 domain-containing protein n=1 Tax=Parashewanella spongiae TaxID=342950 RepID=A0A3A6U9V2_9GAMM|nr:DUF3578 domain-containing protein [Parashewanella spongiae]MCL1077046.1 DUF3578 domain-containing protein [Parashewanella spongiae]RJY18740.1 DUF3578 domain-containing protein [Parashewanella spongiae]